MKARRSRSAGSHQTRVFALPAGRPRRRKTAARAATELMCRFGPDTTLTFVNDAYCRCFQRTPEQLLGTSFLDPVPEGEREIVRAGVLRAERAPDSFEHPVTKADGSIRWHRWTHTPLHDASGRLVEFLAVGCDITDRQAEREALARVNARQHALLQATSGLMFVLRRDGTYVDYHAHDPGLLYASPAAFLGKRVSEVLPAETADMVMQAVHQVFDNPRPVPVAIEYELALPDARLSFEAVLVRTDDQHLVCLARDVTTQKRVQEQHRDLAARLIASQESERQRIGRELHDNLSQEIALLGIDLDRFARIVAVTDEQARHLRQIEARVAEMASDVHQLSHELHPSKLQTLGLVVAIRGLCHDVSSQHGIEIEFSAHDVGTVCGQETALCVYRIAQEALQNVVRHSRARRAAVSLSRDQNEIYLQIADQGIGFDQCRFEHDGLGLVSMRERAWLAGGRLAIHTAPDAGTRIGARVPLGDADRSVS